MKKKFLQFLFVDKWYPPQIAASTPPSCLARRVGTKKSENLSKLRRISVFLFFVGVPLLVRGFSWVALSSFLLPSFIFNDSLISGIQVASARVFWYLEDIYHVNPYNCCVIKATFLNNEHIFRFICARANLELHITHVTEHSSHERKISQLSNYIFYVEKLHGNIWMWSELWNYCGILRIFMKKILLTSEAAQIQLAKFSSGFRLEKVVKLTIFWIFCWSDLFLFGRCQLAGLAGTRHDWEANNKLKCQLKWCHSRLRRRHMIYGGGIKDLEERNWWCWENDDWMSNKKYFFLSTGRFKVIESLIIYSKYI